MTVASTESMDNRKETLKASIINNKICVRQKSVILGWLHYNTKKRPYITVKEKNGGGSRCVKLREASTRDEILEFAKSLFITGQQTVFVLPSVLKYKLGSSPEHSLSDKMVKL